MTNKLKRLWKTHWDYFMDQFTCCGGVKEASKITGLSRSTIYRMVERGRLHNYASEIAKMNACSLRQFKFDFKQGIALRLDDLYKLKSMKLHAGR